MQDKMNDLPDEAFDRRIHDAYESVSLSPEAEGRILAALLEAQASREQEAPRPAEVLPGPASRRRPRLAIALSAAACLALAFVAGRAALVGGVRDGALSATLATEEAAVSVSETDGAAEAPAEGAAPYDAYDAGAAAEDREESVAVGESLDSLAVVTGAYVVLEDGTTFALATEGGALVEVGPEVVGERAGSGEAFSADGTFLWGCELFAPADGSGLAGYLVACPDGTNLCYLVDLAS